MAEVYGATFKVDYFMSGDSSRGLFIGSYIKRTDVHYRLSEMGERDSNFLFGMGVRIGYRFALGDRPFISPWVSARYLFNVDDIELSGQHYNQERFNLFPTLHIGWRL